MDQNPPEGERRRGWSSLIRPHILELNEGQRQALYAQMYADIRSGKIGELEFQREMERIIQEIKNTDPLTKLLNQAGVKEALSEALEQAKTTGSPLSLLFIDGDHFKEINDTLGHDKGDQAILAMAATIKKADPRVTDIKARPYEEKQQAARHGGDEFVVILPGTALWGASIVADRIREDISLVVTAQLKDYMKTFGRPFTASIGIAQFDPQVDQTPEDLIRRADQNLMQVRTEIGKNKRS